MTKYKHISILGDSISTLEGYNPPGYYAYYTPEDTDLFGVEFFEDTYWGMLINHLGAKLLVNNSYSGSCVAEARGYEFPSALERFETDKLHKGSLKPDVILIAMGANDFYFERPLYGDESDVRYFHSAYKELLKRIRANYPQAEIWCLTYPIPRIRGSAKAFSMDNSLGHSIDDYNQVIRDLVDEFQDDKLICLDIFDKERTYESLDGAHPTKVGMEEIFEMIKEAIKLKG